MNFEGHQATGCGSTSLKLEFHPQELACLHLRCHWMGAPEQQIELRFRHRPQSEHYGAMWLEEARVSDRECPLPPSDGPICLEYVRVPRQQAQEAGNDTMAVAGHWNEHFALVLWVHPNSYYDDGSELDPSEYEEGPEAFQPVVGALKWLNSPWKLDLA